MAPRTPCGCGAVNGQGNGGPSNAISATPIATPDQPTITSVVRGDQSLIVAVATASDGGSAITGWEYSTDGGTTWRSAGTAVSPLTITTLSTNGTTPIANGTTYAIAVRATNAAGTSVASNNTSVGPGARAERPDGHADRAEPGHPGRVHRGLQWRLAGHVPRVPPQRHRQLDQRRHLGQPVHDQRPDQRHVVLGRGPAEQRDRDGQRLDPGGAHPADRSRCAGPPSPRPRTPRRPTSAGSPRPTTAAQPVTSYTATAYENASATTPVGTPCTTATLACSITGTDERHHLLRVGRRDQCGPAPACRRRRASSSRRSPVRVPRP